MNKNHQSYSVSNMNGRNQLKNESIFERTGWLNYKCLSILKHLISNSNQYSPIRNTIAANNELNKPNTPVNNEPTKPISTTVSTEQIILIKKAKLLS